MQVLFPIQVHMHHESDVASHNSEHHIVDYHNKVIGDIDQSIEEFTHTIETTSNFIAKKTLDNTVKFVLLFSLILIAITSGTSYFQRLYKSAPIISRDYFQLSPPLRAPPL